MTDKKTVLVTGVAGYWGAQAASRLCTNPDYHVIGIDTDPPSDSIENLDFIQADIRNPALGELLHAEKIKIVCHLKFIEKTERTHSIYDINIDGTINLFNACRDAGVHKIVLRSSTAVYGAHPDNPAFITEETPLRGSRSYAYTRDLLDIEAFCDEFQSQSPELVITILRFANIIGSTASSPMTRLLKLQNPPILLGFDPVMQLIHENDVIEALVSAVETDNPGPFNIAGEGAMPISRLMRLVQKKPLPIFHPVAYKGLQIFRNTVWQPIRYAPLEWDYLRYPWVADLRRMHDEMAFSPLFTAKEALGEFKGPNTTEEDGQISAPSYPEDEDQLRNKIEQRRREREQKERLID